MNEASITVNNALITGLEYLTEYVNSNTFFSSMLTHTPYTEEDLLARHDTIPTPQWLPLLQVKIYHHMGLRTGMFASIEENEVGFTVELNDAHEFDILNAFRIKVDEIADSIRDQVSAAALCGCSAQQQRQGLRVRLAHTLAYMQTQLPPAATH